MTTKPSPKSFVIAAAAASLTLLSTTLAAPVAHADTVADIKATVMKDRAKFGPACPPYAYSGVLQTVAQNVTLGRDVPNYNGTTAKFPGFGNDEASALNNAYQLGFGPSLSRCEFTEFGVAFLGDTGRSDPGAKSAVTIVTGAPAPAAAPAPPANPGPHRILRLHRATVTNDVDVYDNPNGDGDPISFLIKGTSVQVKAPCTPDAFCALNDGTFAWGEFLKNN